MKKKNLQKISRRDFLRLLGIASLSISASRCAPLLEEEASPPEVKPQEDVETAQTESPSADEIEAEYDALVIGAGIAGLTAAYHLRGHHIRVLERADRVGGRTLSGTHEGYTYAKGTEYLGEPEGTLAKIIADLGVQMVEIPSPMDAHFHNGEFYWGGDGIALSYIQEIGLREYNRFMKTMQGAYAEYDDLPETDFDSELARLDDITAREWFNSIGVPEALQSAYNVTAKGLFGATLDEISALSAIPEIAFDFEDAEAIEDVEEDLENTPNQKGEHSESYSCVTGITEITDAIAEELGERIALGAQVTQITRAGEQYIVTYEDEDGLHTLAAGVVILAIPAEIALRIAASVLSAEQKKIMGQIAYAAYLTVALFSDEPIFDKAFDLAAPEGYFFTDVYDATWIQRHYEDEGDAGIITVYIAPQSYKDRSLLDLSEDEILNRVYESLERIFPNAREKVSGYDIQRFPYAYPVFTPGAYQRIARLHEITSGSLLLAGDYMIYPTFEAAAESGALAAEKAADELG